jgi:hypothetical protein
MSNKPKMLFFSGSALQSRELYNVRFSDNLKEVKMSTHVSQVVTEDMNAGQRQTLQWISSLIGFLFTALEGLIGLRVVLKLIDVNSNNAFASFIYSITDYFVAPFNSLMGNPAVGGNVLEVTSLVALIVYALIAAVLVRLVWLLFYHPSARTVTTYERS